ncbi:MAG: hypothetical protein ABSF26_15775 [Thermoguttaceae bacterium]|jgi:flagellar M-ring protein FliF
MDFLSKALAQLNDLFRSMTPGARITAGLLLAVLVVSLGYLVERQVAGPDDFLFNSEPLSADSIQAAEQAFGKANLSSYAVEGARIRVPRAQRAAYMAALADAKALPQGFGSAMEKALEKGNVFESKDQRDVRMKAAIQEELSLVIRSMPGIAGASVLIDSEVQPGLNPTKLKTASVAVKPAGATQLDDSRVESIRYLVAGAVAGLRAENVTVADLNSGKISHGDPEHGGLVGENLFAAVTKQHEQILKAKIMEALAYIPNLTVTTTVILNHEKSTRSLSVKNDPKTIPRRVVEQTKSRTRDSGAAGGGRPGAASQVANGPTALASASGSAKAGHEDEKESQSEQDNSLNTTQEEKETVGLTPMSARVSVAIPSSYFESVWRERNPLKAGEEPKPPDTAALALIRDEVSGSVRKHVAPLLPGPAEGSTDTGEPVTVTTFQDIKPGEIPTPTLLQKLINWLALNWGTLGMGGLLLASLVVLRSMVRGAPLAAAAPGQAALAMPARTAAGGPAAEEAEPPEMVAAHRLRRITGSGPSLRDELTELVKEDPDSAANILRTWIGQAS